VIGRGVLALGPHVSDEPGRGMDVYISIDMEGVAGVATREQCRRGADDFDIGRTLMTGEANAAIAGAFEGGADRVVCNDAHGDMANLLPADLDRRAELVLGSPKVGYSMMEGVSDGFAVALFVGYHAAAGVEAAVLAHTYSGASFYDVRLNGESMTETELNALVAGTHGVPVGLVTGDDKICALAEKKLPGVRTVAVKRGLSYTVGASMHPEEARDAIRAASAEAVRGAPDLEPVTGEGPFTIEVDLTDLRRAELCGLVPGVERSGRTVRYTTGDYLEAFRCMRAFMYLAAAAPM
jgi:D-amino peptidase